MQHTPWMTDDALTEARDMSWVEWTDWEHDVYYPRWYKQHGKFINPWLTVSELKEAQTKRQALFRTWIGLHFACIDRKLPGMDKELYHRWKEISTPNGRRFVRD